MMSWFPILEDSLLFKNFLVFYMFDEIFRKLNEGKEIKFENIGTITVPKRIGPYTLFQQIGKGSFSVIFNAYLPISSVWNACKIIPKNYTVDKIPIKRFIDEEVKIVQLLNHPNIIKCKGYFEDSECIYVFMPYYENGNLQQLIDKQGGIHILEIKSSKQFNIYTVKMSLKNNKI